MFVCKSRFLTRGEVWFGDQPDATRVDWIYHRQRPSPLPGHRWKHYYTSLVDLRKSPAALFADLDDKNARQITEAQERDKLRCDRLDPTDSKLIDEVEQMWNQFAVAHNTPKLDRPWLEEFRRAGALDVVAVRDAAGQALVYHLVFLTPTRARQLIAISPHKAVPDIAWRNAISRANRLAHWHNFLTFRERGISYFDFGGWYPGSTDIQLLGMNAFKRGFGGQVVREFDCEEPVTLKGRLILGLAEAWARLKRREMHGDSDRDRKQRANDLERPNVSPAFR